MKKLQIIILTLLLIFNLQSNIYAEKTLITTNDEFLYRYNSVINMPSEIYRQSTDSRIKGYYTFYNSSIDRTYNFIFFDDVKLSKEGSLYRVQGGHIYDGSTVIPNGTLIDPNFYRYLAGIGSDSFSIEVRYLDYLPDSNEYIIKDMSDGGSTTPDGGNNQDNGQSQGLGILNNINNTINSLVRNINTLFSNITNSIKKAVENVLKGIKEIFEKFFENLKKLLTDLLDKLKEMLKEIFIPDEEFLLTHFTEIKQLLSNKFDLKFIENINQLNTNQSLFSDITLNGNKIVDMQFLNQSIPKIRIFTDGFFWFLLICYQYDQLYFLIRGTKPLGNTVKTTFSKGSEQT